MSQQTTNFYHNMEVCATTVFTIEYIMCLELFIRVPIRRATQKSDSSRFRISGFGFRRLKPTFAVGFGFRVSSIETHFRCRFRISGFGFRRLKPTFAVGFGFRVSSLETNFRCRFRVSGFGFRRLKPTFAVGFGFRVSGFVAWNQLSLSVSGFVAWKPTFAAGFGFRVSSPETNFRCRFRISGFGFRVSGFVDWS